MAIAENEMTMKNCAKGYPAYYAVILDPVTGIEISRREISGTEYIDNGGVGGLNCPPSGNMVLNPKPTVTGNLFHQQVAKHGKQLKLDSKTMALVQQLMPYRFYFLTQLRNRGIQVLNPNNIFEILTKYGKFNPNFPAVPNEVMIAGYIPGKASFRSTYQIRDNSGAQYQAKSMEAGGASGGGIDVSWVGGLVSLIGGIAGSINSNSVQGTLDTWAANYVAYMQKDFAVIEDSLKASGPAQALNTFYSYKNGSWAGLDHDLNDHVTKNNLQMPASVLDLRVKQDQLEARLKALVQGGGNNPPKPVNNGSNNGNLQLPSPNDTSAGGWMMRNWYWIGLSLLVIVVLFFVLKKSKKG